MWFRVGVRWGEDQVGTLPSQPGAPIRHLERGLGWRVRLPPHPWGRPGRLPGLAAGSEQAGGKEAGLRGEPLPRVISGRTRVGEWGQGVRAPPRPVPQGWLLVLSKRIYCWVDACALLCFQPLGLPEPSLCPPSTGRGWTWHGTGVVKQIPGEAGAKLACPSGHQRFTANPGSMCQVRMSKGSPNSARDGGGGDRPRERDRERAGQRDGDRQTGPRCFLPP